MSTEKTSKIIGFLPDDTPPVGAMLSLGFQQFLTRTSRNQKGKVAQGMACQRQEKWDKREAVPDGDFP